jgi:hypothetical protein
MVDGCDHSKNKLGHRIGYFGAADVIRASIAMLILTLASAPLENVPMLRFGSREILAELRG